VSDETRRLRLSAEGRGRHYSRARGAVESLLRAAYLRDWPGRAWGLVPGSERVRVERFSVAADRGGRPPLTLAFASDLHFGPTTAPATLERARAALAEARPDLLVLGGDYVFLDATEARARALGDWVAGIPMAPGGVRAAVLGNHDLWTRHDRLEAALEGAGVELLVNRAITLPPPHDDIRLVGIDEPWTGAPDAGAALSGAHDGVTLAVAHSPDGVPHFEGAGASLILCGHTHGGQIALPGHRWVVMPSEVGRRYPFGLHRDRDTWIYVSRGLGNVEVPLRTFAPPDVAIVQVG